jgi:ATP-dependent RNA helicase DDX56/DBP9
MNLVSMQEFNRGLFDYLIATDAIKVGPSKAKKKASKESKVEPEGQEGDGEGQQPKKKKRRLGDQEFGVVRGIDFKNVRTVSASLRCDCLGYDATLMDTCGSGEK